MNENQNVRRVAIGAYSAYAIAVKYGYTGTEEEWIRSVEADRVRAEEAAEKADDAVKKAVQKAVDEGLFKGDPGPEGPKGEKGDKGDKGADAETLTWTLLEQVTTEVDISLFERTADADGNAYDLKGIKVTVRTGIRQSRGTLRWTCVLADGTEMTGTVACEASNSSTTPLTYTYAHFIIVPFFGHYLPLAGAAATGEVPGLSLPADHGCAAVPADSRIRKFTLAANNGTVPLRYGAIIGIWGLCG